jgi:multidrug efflux pump subunit AcrB
LKATGSQCGEQSNFPVAKKYQQDERCSWVRVTADGHDAVLFQVYQQPGGNTVQITRDIKEKLKSLHNQIPEGVHLANWYDQSELILASNGSAREAVVIGVGFARPGEDSVFWDDVQ